MVGREAKGLPGAGGYHREIGAKGWIQVRGEDCQCKRLARVMPTQRAKGVLHVVGADDNRDIPNTTMPLRRVMC